MHITCVFVVFGLMCPCALPTVVFDIMTTTFHDIKPYKRICIATPSIHAINVVQSGLIPTRKIGWILSVTTVVVFANKNKPH